VQHCARELLTRRGRQRAEKAGARGEQVQRHCEKRRPSASACVPRARAWRRWAGTRVWARARVLGAGGGSDRAPPHCARIHARCILDTWRASSSSLASADGTRGGDARGGHGGSLRVPRIAAAAPARVFCIGLLGNSEKFCFSQKKRKNVVSIYWQ